jgi:hypothetical protein
VSFGLPFAPLVLERAQQLFLLAVHRDDRPLLLLELLAQRSDLLKLLITVGMGDTLHRFLVHFERISQIVQKLCQCCLFDGMSLFGQPLHQVRERVRGPFYQAHRIPFRLQ